MSIIRKQKQRNSRRKILRLIAIGLIIACILLFVAPMTLAAETAGGEASLILPDLGTVEFYGINARVLAYGLVLLVCALGSCFWVL